MSLACVPAGSAVVQHLRCFGSLFHRLTGLLFGQATSSPAGLLALRRSRQHWNSQ